ncbi:MAG: FadR family transcriptional regulator [Deltaproteobacteria bacterium]|nr:FadR family transcriptional regulator [Deltaproteobacteria bacterium]
MAGERTGTGGFEPVRRASLAKLVSEQIRRRIFDGRLRAGDRIPSERELSGQLGSNRNTVREAIRTLEELNLVHVRHGNGMVVRDFRREGELGLLPFYLAEGADADEALRALEDVLRLRRLVLSEAGALASERAGVEDVTRLRTAAEAAQERAADPWRQDLDFFRLLVEASHSLVAVWLFNTFARAFTGLVERLPELWVQQAGRKRTWISLVRAVERHKPDEARRILERYYAAVDRVIRRRTQPSGGRR